MMEARCRLFPWKNEKPEYEDDRCCSCFERLAELDGFFNEIKQKMVTFEYMIEYGWTAPDGKLMHNGGLEPWIDYGNDGNEFLFEMPESKVGCK